MAVREVLLLGDPRLYQVCDPVQPDELPGLAAVVDDLHDTLMDFRARYGAGRAVAAPQIGVMKRLIYMNIDRPVPIVNPRLDRLSPDLIELWDDCMSFPDLLVRVRRHRTCRITFRDLDWQEHTLHLEDDLSELLQHEYDHLDGILAVSRAIDAESFCLRSQLALARAVRP
jgi:peptide deformylase